jgi:uncharacterized protein (UPF0297 family)
MLPVYSDRPDMSKAKSIEDIKALQKRKRRSEPKFANEIVQIYKAYLNSFKLSGDKYYAGGGENAFGFVVKSEHAQIAAELLFNYLLEKKEEYNNTKMP